MAITDCPFSVLAPEKNKNSLPEGAAEISVKVDEREPGFHFGATDAIRIDSNKRQLGIDSKLFWAMTYAVSGSI